ncbi:hypothetical protein [Mycolicibacter minnesotensis]
MDELVPLSQQGMELLAEMLGDVAVPAVVVESVVDPGDEGAS